MTINSTQNSSIGLYHSLFWIEYMYEQWKDNPNSLGKDWNHYFEGFELGSVTVSLDTCQYEQNDLRILKTSGIQSLIYRYRSLGHLLACTDPLSPCMLNHPLLELHNFGLVQSDLDVSFTCRRFYKTQATLREIISCMRETYCHEIGVEFMHIQDPDERQWLIDKMELSRNRSNLSNEDRLHLLKKLQEATHFESFLQKRFPGHKRFSLEGGEVLIPLLDTIVTNSPRAGITDIVLGMAHRGRLNVLANILGKSYEAIFAEFRDAMENGFDGDGDVKYHKGFSTDKQLPDGNVHLTLVANPSHLEAVNAVVQGKSRARQDQRGAEGTRQVLPIIIHGDAAFAGQGVGMELFNMSRLQGYSTGGTIHIVLNNQIGFTTLPQDSRSTLYATDVAKMIACPVFHVQGESPEAAKHAVQLALEYRMKFGKDVVVEMICYRRHGHNEGDEPSFTQPLMYNKISIRPTVNKIYSGVLLENDVSLLLIENIERDVKKQLEESFERIPAKVYDGFSDAWSSVSQTYRAIPVYTGLPAEKLLLISHRLVELPPEFSPHPKVHALIQKRFEAVLKGTSIDWGNAEMLAYASLLDEGVPVRISGQDSQRGTFSHRHCILHDINDASTYMPLNSVSNNDAVFQVWDSPLSEYGVLGFEYGYSIESPLGLTIWEAQFGDFVNGAQVVIDQFIASGETKWNRASGLVLFLPHGYEGQGAEHSSARIERFLQLCASNNMVVANPTTPAQMFHLLRRQVKQSFRKPLIIFTPKSLLRHPDCVSSVDSFSSETFHEILSDSTDPGVVKRVLFCSGKVYFDLKEERDRRGRSDTAIIRIEQLYPLCDDLVVEKMLLFSESVTCIWVQEEPENMGAWQHLQPKLVELCGSIRLVSRAPDSCPAVGSLHLHKLQQSEIIKRAFEE